MLQKNKNIRSSLVTVVILVCTVLALTSSVVTHTDDVDPFTTVTDTIGDPGASHLQRVAYRHQQESPRSITDPRAPCTYPRGGNKPDGTNCFYREFADEPLKQGSCSSGVCIATR